MLVPQPEPRGYSGNLGSLFAEHAEEDRTALLDLRDPQISRPVTYQELDSTCNAVARGLAREGLGPGDRVGVLSLNRTEFIATLLGAMRVGIIPVPINVKFSANRIAYILADAKARVVFAEPDLTPLLPTDIPVVEFADEFEQFLDFGPFEPFEPRPDSIAIQPYTSGSTGQPKGVLLTHYGQNWSRRILAHTRNTSETDVILVAAPLYHKNALNAVKQGLTAGAMLPLLPRFSVERYIDAIGRHRCTVISGVPTMISTAKLRSRRAPVRAAHLLPPPPPRQSTYKESMDNLEKLKDESAPTIKLLKAATPSGGGGGKAAGKDEV